MHHLSIVTLGTGDEMFLTRGVEKALREAFRIASEPQTPAEPLDWMETMCPAKWKCGEDIVEYDWYEEFGAEPLLYEVSVCGISRRERRGSLRLVNAQPDFGNPGCFRVLDKVPAWVHLYVPLNWLAARAVPCVITVSTAEQARSIQGVRTVCSSFEKVPRTQSAKS